MGEICSARCCCNIDNPVSRVEILVGTEKSPSGASRSCRYGNIDPWSNQNESWCELTGESLRESLFNGSVKREQELNQLKVDYGVHEKG
jgi:hypothetical protein